MRRLSLALSLLFLLVLTACGQPPEKNQEPSPSSFDASATAVPDDVWFPSPAAPSESMPSGDAPSNTPTASSPNTDATSPALTTDEHATPGMDSATPSPKASPATTPPVTGSAAPVPPAPKPSVSPEPASEDITVVITALDFVWPTVIIAQADEIQTAFDALSYACNESGLALTVKGSGSTVYVAAIGEYREFDFGPLSGWLFWVNGRKSTVGAGACSLSPGDRVAFAYVEDFSKF